MILGAAYYPEHEEPAQWPIDYKKLSAAGIRQIRIAEFAWTVLEPQDGQFDWSWLDEAIETAAAHGLDVVLCTPTACPPVWLVERHPDVLPVNRSGRTVGFGARQHRSYHSANYLRYAMRIVAEMGKRYGHHPAVVAWQLDNEFGGETKYDFGACARDAFHAYLADEYGTVEELNRRWGTVFWSQRYERWDQIPLPAPIDADVTMWHHPSLELAFAKFSSLAITRFAAAQASALRPYTGDRPITTNAFMFRYGDSVSWPVLFEELDVVGMDIYSDKPHEIAFYGDACRGVLRRPFWMMEYGTGSRRLLSEMELVRDRGCSRFFLFKTKPFPWGQEQGSGAPELLTITGEPSANYGAVRDYAQAHADYIEPAVAEPSPIGLYYHFESSWSYRIAVSDRVPYPDYLVDTVYRSLYEGGLSVDLLYNASQIVDYKLIIVPLHVLHDEELEDRLLAFVHGGGRLIVTTDLFRKNRDNVFLTQVPRLYAALLGWQQPNFVPDAIAERPAGGIYAAGEYGSGSAWMIARDASAAEWRAAVASALMADQAIG
ncbi:beta-galactosidase [Paenibacillus xanthanilyticus]|uniref:beta-galactosidase n=1 Tax=Paenibacillus xanthanilyticus TaxID=1783531 RepID=A0ABV8JXQ8_9BACL